MGKRRLLLPVLAAIFLFGNGPPLSSWRETRAEPGLRSESIPNRIVPGVELKNVDGWLANIYPWDYRPEWSTVHPVPSLWDPPKWDPREQKYIGQQQSWEQINRQSRQLDEYGSGADVLEFNVCPDNQDYNHWLRTYLGKNSSRPFFILYEHIHGNCNYVEFNGAKNMNLAKNRQAFADDIEFIVKNIVLPNKDRYVTVNGRAVIFLWAATGMTGDFASLLQTIKIKYPVFFVGSVGVMSGGWDVMTLRNLSAFDGFMEYGLVNFDKDKNGVLKPDNYITMIRQYEESSGRWRQIMRSFESQTKIEYIFIPTFQAAYDDTNFPDRNGGIYMYPRTRDEMEDHAKAVNRRMANGQNDGYEDFYDNIGPFVIYSELPEGGAVIESRCLPETMDRPGRFVGCGTQRLEILKKYFGR